MLALCLALRDEYSLAAVTNDIFTKYGKTCSFPPARLLRVLLYMTKFAEVWRLLSLSPPYPFSTHT